MSIKMDRLGEVRMMNCGEEAKIIAYRNCADIDVMFRDGTVRTNMVYRAFLAGSINKDSHTVLRDKRLNETRVMNCGLKAKIIAYRGSKDIDVMFEDGAIRYNVAYRSFENGSLTSDKSRVNKSRIGEERIMNCGEKARIIDYRSRFDIDVMFEDGSKVTNTTYYSFVKGCIKYPNRHVNEERMMSCGLKAKIIAYRSSMDIDVMFEDGTIVRNRTYGNFVKGAIAKEGRTLRNRIGEERVMNCGLKAKIIDYRRSNDIDVMFEDGTKVTNVLYNSFVKGHIASPNRFLNEERMMKCGEKARVIGYRSSKDIDVMFEDGTVRTNVSMQSFRNGVISKVLRATSEEIKSRLGEVRIMSCGLRGKIIRYNTSDDIDVEFEDGTVRTHCTYGSFCNGWISYKKRKNIEIEIGGNIKLRCGFYAKLLDKNGSICKIEYEDGVIVEKPQYTINQVPYWARRLKFIKVYTLNGVNFYVMKCNGKRYLGTVKEIKEQLEAYRQERRNE